MVNGIRTIDPEKLIQARGSRTRREIEELSAGEIKEQDLYGWEHNKWKPSPKKLPYLLKALGTTYEAISSEIAVEFAN